MHLLGQPDAFLAISLLLPGGAPALPRFLPPPPPPPPSRTTFILYGSRSGEGGGGKKQGGVVVALDFSSLHTRTCQGYHNLLMSPDTRCHCYC